MSDAGWPTKAEVLMRGHVRVPGDRPGEFYVLLSPAGFAALEQACSEATQRAADSVAAAVANAIRGQATKWIADAIAEDRRSRPLPAPVFNVTMPKQEPPVVNVQIEQQPDPTMTRKIVRDRAGRIEKIIDIPDAPGASAEEEEE